MSDCTFFVVVVVIGPRLTVYLFVSALSLLFSLQSLLFLTTSPVSGVLDSHCSDQWAHVVLGSLPLLNHQSCTNLHNSPPRAQPHQSYPHRMGSVSLTHPHSPRSQVFGGWKSVLYAVCLSWMWPVHLEAVSSSYSWRTSICRMLNRSLKSFRVCYSTTTASMVITLLLQIYSMYEKD